LFGTDAEVEAIYAKLAEASDIENIIPIVHDLYPELSEGETLSKALVYQADMQTSIGESTWRVVESVLASTAPIVPSGTKNGSTALSQAAKVLLKTKTVVGLINEGVPLKTAKLLAELPEGTKYMAQEVISAAKMPDGKIVWLEKGNNSAGLMHIYDSHEIDFINKGISHNDVPTIVMNALEKGNVVGTNGTANVYRITYNGVEQNIAIGVGSNGYVVRANPVSSWKPLQ